MKKNLKIIDVNERLRHLIKDVYKLKLKDIADKISQIVNDPKKEISETSLSNYITKQRKPDYEKIQIIAQALEVPIGYFFGEYDLTDDGRFIKVSGDEPSLDDFVLVNIATPRPSAGGGSWEFEYVEDEENSRKFAFRKDWVKKVATSPNNLVLFYVQGDSMYPTLKDGDIILVDKGRNKIEDIQSNKIYVVRLGNEVFVKRIFLVPSDTIKLISDNKQFYPEIEIHAYENNNFQILGKVIWAGVDLA